MKTQYRVLILALLLLAALVCYGFSSTTGVVGFVFAGMAFETAFWLGLLKKSKRAPH